MSTGLRIDYRSTAKQTSSLWILVAMSIVSEDRLLSTATMAYISYQCPAAKKARSDPTTTARPWLRRTPLQERTSGAGIARVPSLSSTRSYSSRRIARRQNQRHWQASVSTTDEPLVGGNFKGCRTHASTSLSTTFTWVARNALVDHRPWAVYRRP